MILENSRSMLVLLWKKNWYDDFKRITKSPWQVTIQGLTGDVLIDNNGHRYNHSLGVYKVGFKQPPRKVMPFLF